MITAQEAFWTQLCIWMQKLHPCSEVLFIGSGRFIHYGHSSEMLAVTLSWAHRTVAKSYWRLIREVSRVENAVTEALEQHPMH